MKRRKRQKTEQNKRLLRWQIAHVHILVLIMSRVERTYPFRQIARRARTEAVPAFWKIKKTHILATRGLVRDLSLVNWLAVIQSRLVVVKVHTVRVELNV